MSKLRVVCLVSGGKDSLFSILHCLQNGHEVVALANLHPRVPAAEEDIDSYMYQTVGHSIIPLYEKALGLPLYRHEILGSAVNQDKSYGQASEDADETESLVPLLQVVKKRHPEVNAVSTGAILSDYQRTRVESVALRLGLTPLSYLWQWPNLPPHTQRTLLEDMAAAGQDSRIIKVASGGLDDSFLWTNVADLRTMHRIDKAVKRFGSDDDGAVLGEGGEYETLAISGPPPLWKGAIDVSDEDLETVTGEAGSASVRIKGARVVDQPSDQQFAGVRTPSLLEPNFETLLANGLASDGADSAPSAGPTSSSLSPLSNHFCYDGLTGAAGKPAADQMANIMRSIRQLLELQNLALDFSNVAYVSIVLRNMADFAAINTVYSASFTMPNPPARITLADASVLPEGKDVMVTLTCVRGPPNTRHGLHVQSQSYWAPANIGPYSQAISVPASCNGSEGDQQIVYIAGQIPLLPASMDLAWPDAARGNMEAFSKQSVLAAQHFMRIGRAMRVSEWACGLAFITAASQEDADRKGAVARRTWNTLHRRDRSHFEDEDDTEDEDFDIWNVKHGVQRNQRPVKDSTASSASGSGSRAGGLPRLEVIVVEALPRGAAIEWVTYGMTSFKTIIPAIPHYQHLLELFKDRIIG